MLSRKAPPESGDLFSDLRLAGRGSVVAAVSGGGDSLALLLLLRDHLQGLPRAPSLLAVTVDHGLRAGSAEEAHVVGRLAAAHGIAHRTLLWQGAKPTRGISAAARDARLDLLAGAARQAGADLVLTGHTADDQAETLAMRLERGEGRGAAGIAPATLHRAGTGDVWFVRPLLETRRQALRAFLRARGVSWIEDPTNMDRRFERARLRHELDEAAILRLLARAREAAAGREAAGRKAAALLAGAADRTAPGPLWLSLQALEDADGDAAVYTLRILLAVAGGTPHLPDERRARTLLQQVSEPAFRASLSRVVATRSKDRLYLHRELRNLPEAPLVEGMVWDGRYRVTGVTASGMTICPLGMKLARAEDIPRSEAPERLVRAALAGEPAIRQGGRLLGLAGKAKDLSLTPLAGPWARLLPSFDLAPAAAVAGLLGAGPLPPSPWRGHKDD